MKTLNKEQIKSQAETLLNAHKNYLLSVARLVELSRTSSEHEEEYLNLLYSGKKPETQTAMIEFFRSFDDVKKNVKNVPAFNESVGFSIEYRELMTA